MPDLFIDIGSTTIKYLFKNQNYIETNQTKKYGLDIISKVSFSLKKSSNPGKMHNTLKTQILALCYRFNPDNIYIAANSVITYIFLNRDLSPFAASPFKITKTPLYVNYNNNKFFIMPLIKRFIGGDCLANIIYLKKLKIKNCILMDIGTNTEIILKKADTIYTVSVPSGPVFEGFGLSNAKPFSLESITDIKLTNRGFDFFRDNKRVRLKNNIGFAAAGYLNLVAQLYNQDIIDSYGKINPVVFSEPVLKYFVSQEKNDYKINFNKDLYVTGKDIKKLILPIASARSAIENLIKKAGIVPETVFITGNISKNLKKQAMKLFIPYRNIKLKKVEDSVIQGLKIYSSAENKAEFIKKIKKQIKVLTDLRVFDFYLKKI